MAKYSTSNDLAGSQQNLSTSYKTLVSIFASNATALRRGKVFDVLVGVNGTPADNEIEVNISRMTADGTGTVATALPLDPADSAMLGVSKANYTAEPTVTASTSLLYTALNQRSTFRWVAREGSELVYPATNANGLVLRAKSAAYASTMDGQLLTEEQ